MKKILVIILILAWFLRGRGGAKGEKVWARYELKNYGVWKNGEKVDWNTLGADIFSTNTFVEIKFNYETIYNWQEVNAKEMLEMSGKVWREVKE